MNNGLLSGIKVVEYSSFVAGPYCAKLFADLGAEVIKIETPAGDEARKRGPYLNDVADPELSGLYLYNNTNKKGVTLNLESATGREIFKKLMAEADIFIEDQAPGRLAELGLGYDELEKINPRLIMASITPFGQDGPYCDFKSYYLNTYHSSGGGYVLPAASPNADREPVVGGGYVGESDAGVNAAVSIMSALFWRESGGSGQYIDISKQESQMALERVNIVRFYELGKSPTRYEVNRVRDTLVHCKDGGYVMIVLHPENQWRGVVEALGNPEWANDDKFNNPKGRETNFGELKVKLNEEAAKYDTNDLFSMIQAKGTACGPANSAKQVFNSPQKKARDYFTTIDHPKAGPLSYPDLPCSNLSISKTEGKGAPLLGQHNEEIYCTGLGYSKQDVLKLKEAGVI